MAKLNLKKYFQTKQAIVFWVLFVLLLFFAISSLIFHYVYYNRIYPGVFVGQVDLSGKNKVEAEQEIKNEAKRLEQGIVFYYKNKELTVGPQITSFDIDLSRQIFSVDSLQTVQTAFLIGRNTNFLTAYKQKIISLFFQQQIPLVAQVNKTELKKVLEKTFNQFDKPVQEATLIMDKDGNFLVKKEVPGQEIDYDLAIQEFVKKIKLINPKPIGLTTKSIQPHILKQNVMNIDHQAKMILALAPLELVFKEKKWIIDENKLKSWLQLSMLNNEIVVSLDSKKIVKFLESKIAEKINQPAIDARFKMKGEKVSMFQRGQDGREVDIMTTVKYIQQAIKDKKQKIEIAMKTISASQELEKIEKMGITEIIGTGKSNFRGSPWNRKHNIKVGADALNGLLIKPGEEFSLLHALGEIDAQHGYLQELVIKGNETIPEYGGGLCQIGTTMFRTVLNSGLLVTMRRNHSYRVSYYEPAGTDATIYDPWPDFKFINDTKHYILIQTRIEGTELIFDFWGTKDGRKVIVSKPVIYNITKPEPTKIVETTKLPIGKKKCTEHAHNGADAYFEYDVQYADGTEKKKTFYSHYVPWQEVCLLGVEKLSSDAVGIGIYEKQIKEKETKEANN